MTSSWIFERRTHVKCVHKGVRYWYSVSCQVSTTVLTQHLLGSHQIAQKFIWYFNNYHQWVKGQHPFKQAYETLSIVKLDYAELIGKWHQVGNILRFSDVIIIPHASPNSSRANQNGRWAVWLLTVWNLDNADNGWMQSWLNHMSRGAACTNTCTSQSGMWIT